jgi:hypothetical protein
MVSHTMFKETFAKLASYTYVMCHKLLHDDRVPHSRKI